MKVILREDDKKLGSAGDVVEVKAGFARNYLFPRNLAVRADASQMKRLEHERKVLNDKKEKGLKEFKALAAQIDKASCTISVTVGDEDKMFGSVTSIDIAEALAKEGVELDKKHIHLEEPIKALGVFSVPIKLSPEVETDLKVWVIKA
jgi:large subunit ribosomal protein L9